MKKILFLIVAMVMGLSVSAQELVLELDFDTHFDNREYASNGFNIPQTLFSSRLTPRVGIQWEGVNRLMVGVDLSTNFESSRNSLIRVQPTVYYQFKTENIQANAGMFDKNELIGEYSPAFFSDSVNFYQNKIAGFMGRYTSSAREKTYIEMALNWEGISTADSREMFRIISAGRYTFGKVYMGYALTVFHFAHSATEQNLTDNALANPFVGIEFDAYFDFNIKGGFLIAPQRARSLDNSWRMPKGGMLDISLTKWGLKLENSLYLGENLQPHFNTYGGELYAGERFFSTTKGIYNRTEIGYEKSFFNKTLSLEAGMVFHYDGVGLGNQQVVKLSVNLQKLVNLTKKR